MRAGTACVVLLVAATLAGCARGQGPRAARMAQELEKRFTLADLDRDGRLSREEARTGMPWVHGNFDAIDAGRTGYVSLDQLRQYARSNARRGRRAGGSTAP